MKSSQIIEKALEEYAPMDFLCNVIERLPREKDVPENDAVRVLNLINNRLGNHYTLTTWLGENDAEYAKLCAKADPYHVGIPGNSSKAMKSEQCHIHRVLYWRRLVSELQATGD